jgi:hypothetical protein
MRADPGRESLRWGRAVQACDTQLGLETRAIHVMDREGDSYDLLAELHAAGARYVIRLAHDCRRVGEHEKLRQVVGRATCLFRREVRVNPHGAGRPKDHHAVRQAREATLDVSAMAVELARSSHFAPGSPPSLKVHVVTVMERDCPEGDEPIAWYLVTNEPIATPEQVAAVVDAYRTRWVVEEFFKALKSGCPIERRQMESYGTLRIALALFLPIAVRLLALRDAARSEPDAPCATLSARHLQVLRACGNRPMSATPSNQEVGGHLRSNGPPGWIVLRRAFEAPPRPVTRSRRGPSSCPTRSRSTRGGAPKARTADRSRRVRSRGGGPSPLRRPGQPSPSIVRLGSAARAAVPPARSRTAAR